MGVFLDKSFFPRPLKNLKVSDFMPFTRGFASLREENQRV